MTTSEMPALYHRRSAAHAAQVLARARAVLDPALRAAIDRLPALIRRIAGYQLGWWDRDGLPLDGGAGGKAIRPALALLCGQAVGGHPDSALPGAVAVELVHNFSLLHDDVMDGARTRRHRPAAWRVFGTSQAILAGDSLLVAGVEALTADRAPVAVRALHDLSSTLQDLCAGQSADLRFEAGGRVSLGDCHTMVAGKTSALLGSSCSLGALYGGGSPEQVRLLRMFGERLGQAFQLVDDVLGIWGDPAVTGKPVGADLATRKRSLPIMAALASDSPAGRELDDIYASPAGLSAADLAHVADLVERTGARKWAAESADKALAAAAACLDAALPAAQPATDLRSVADLIAARDH